MAYLTYDEYVIIGGVLDETAYKRNYDRAHGIINNATHGRVDKMPSIPDQVKALCRDLVEYLHNNPATEKAISSRSQSAGSVSESENYESKSKEDRMQEIEDLICDYLISVKNNNGTPLLYRGCRD